MDLAQLALTTAFAMAGAFVVRSLVEYLVGHLIDAMPKLEWTKKALPFLALAGGLGFAYWYNLDFFAVMRSLQPDAVGVFLTGTLIGQGAEVVHKFVFEFVLEDWLGV